MGDISFHDKLSFPNNSIDNIDVPLPIYDGVVLNFTWAQLEPQKGEYHLEVIRDALGVVSSYNSAQSSRKLGVRLDIWPGINAPPWAKEIAGAPIAIKGDLPSEVANGPQTIGRFWHVDYRRAWRKLLDLIGQSFDADPNLRAITNTSCSTETDEPFALNTDHFSVANLLAGGFSDKEYMNCLQDSIYDYSSWRKSYIEYPVNPLVSLSSGAPKVDLAATVMLIRQWKAMLGNRGTVSNHDLQCGAQDPEFANIVRLYETFRGTRGLITLQVWGPNVSDWNATLTCAFDARATAIEWWNGSMKNIEDKISRAKLYEWRKKFR